MGGSQEMKVKTVTGRSSKKEISQHAMAAVSAGIKFSSALSPVSAHVEVKSQYDFSKPTYVYQKGITINYVDGTSDKIGTGMFYSHEPMPFSETIPYCKMNI